MEVIDGDKLVNDRWVRLKDAPEYLKMNKNDFKTMVRPFVPFIRVSPKRGVAYDRLDLDQWMINNKVYPKVPIKNRRYSIWEQKERQGCSSGAVSGTFKSKSKGSVYEKAREQLAIGKPS